MTKHYVVAGLGADQIDPDAKLSYQDEFVAGFEYEAFPNTNLGVRYIHRNVGRVLEDIADAPAVAYDLGLPGLGSVEYILTNPGSELPDPLPRAGRGVRGSQARLRRGGVHDGQPLLEQLAGCSPATAGRGSSAPSRASTARTTASRTRGSPRSTTSPPTTRRSPPSAARGSATWATSATWVSSARARCRSTARTRSSWPAPTRSRFGLVVRRQPEPVVGQAADGAGGAGALRQRQRNPADPARRGLRDLRRLQGAHAVRDPARSPGQLRAARSAAAGSRCWPTPSTCSTLRRVTDYNAAVEFPTFGVTNPDFGTPTSANVSGQMYQAPFQLRVGARFAF